MIWFIFFVPLILLGLLLVGIEIRYRYGYNNRIINLIPGPKTIPMLGNAREVTAEPSILFKSLRKWSEEYYPVYRLWSTPLVPVICLVSPEDMQTVLSNPIHNEKSLIYGFFHDWLREGLLTSNFDKWQQRRKILTPTFHFNILKRFIEIFNEHAAKFVNDFKNDNAKEIKILQHISKSSLYTITETAMGIDLSNCESETKYRNSIYRMGEILMYRMLRPLFYFRIVNYFASHYTEERMLLKYLKKFTKEVIAEREQMSQINNIAMPPTENEDDDVYIGKKRKQLAMLDLLLLAKNNGQINEEGILEEVDTFMFEGHDTVSMSLQYTLMLIANHSNVQEKLYEEVTTILDDNRKPSYEDLNEMTYVEMVIKESLRLYPSVPTISRVSGEEITASSGHKIPAGTILVLNIFDTHRLEHIYPEPEKFIPERFSAENSKNRHPYAYLAFSAGSRNCIGKKYAMLNMKCKVAAIVKNFILLPVTKPEDIILVSDIVLRTKDKIKVQFKLR